MSVFGYCLFGVTPPYRDNGLVTSRKPDDLPAFRAERRDRQPSGPAPGSRP
ncbi:hypothetical protein [Plantactinospora soyae]|uniref:Uncharacterized protein n=1 Tax=Plantactinospora soyae TaxID=1544732 RepID=A0A927M003_9ACTN|nr:hypothetical protein [Plantactinospora soyae]MBE1485514.1 hypothetical protein [Plantactinospora soyae]